MRTLFVYYKVPAAERARWHAEVQAFCSTARERFAGLSVELMQRPEPSAEGLETWMEVWRQDGGVDAQLASTLDAMAQSRGLPFRRASEVFVALRA